MIVSLYRPTTYNNNMRITILHIRENKLSAFARLVCKTGGTCMYILTKVFIARTKIFTWYYAFIMKVCQANDLNESIPGK